MTIASSTQIQAYQLRAGGSRARMAILRMIAADSQSNFNPDTRLQPGDWRGARTYTMKGYEAAFGALSQGRSGGGPVWYSHTGEYFRNERYADEIVRIRHQGWFCDTNQEETARGIVASLTHNRFIAGYELSMNDERVYFGEVFANDDDAARMADEHARVIAEQEMEHAERWNEARELESRIDDSLTRLRECIVLRHEQCMQYVRAEIAELIDSIRDDRRTLANDYAEVL